MVCLADPGSLLSGALRQLSLGYLSEPALSKLGDLSRRFPKQPMTIIVNSPGGSVLAGLALYDYVQKLRAARRIIREGGQLTLRLRRKGGETETLEIEFARETGR